MFCIVHYFVVPVYLCVDIVCLVNEYLMKIKIFSKYLYEVVDSFEEQR